MADDADVIIVGAGLAGLVAAAELAEAGRKTIIVDQEPEQSLGGQAFWSLGGLFLVDSPEQRRMRIRDSHDLALEDWMGTAAFDRDGRSLAAQMGRGLCRFRRRRKARLAAAARHALLSRSLAGPSAAATMPTDTAIRCRAFTSPGAPAPACSNRSSSVCATRAKRGLDLTSVPPSGQTN